MTFDKIQPDVSRACFDAPLVELKRLFPEKRARVLLKLAPSITTGSIKDFVASSIVDAGEALGHLTPRTQIVEATSGAWGVALACVAAARGYELVIVAPENLPDSKRRLIAAFGAKLRLTPEIQGFSGARRRALEAGRNDPKIWVPDLFANPANSATYEATIGPALWRATEGRIDFFVSYVGSGGSFVGTTRFLRRHDPNIKCVAVETRDSPVLSSGRPSKSVAVDRLETNVVPHLFLTNYASSIESVTTEEAQEWSRRLARTEGVLAGATTGANLAVVARLASLRENQDKTLATLAFDCGTAL